jgi:hypothetical protein
MDQKGEKSMPVRRLISDAEWSSARDRLTKSAHRSGFSLGEQERVYIQSRGMDLVEQHAIDFITRRVAPANPRNDGRQTPLRGHPVFIAQHATATCCRKCFHRMHGIETGRPLTKKEIEYAAGLIVRWLCAQCNGEPPL